MKIRDDVNEYGTPVTWFKCDDCGNEYDVCPKPNNERDWQSCGSIDCKSYDPGRDADILFMSDKEIKERKNLVSIKMLQMRKKGVQRDICRI